MTDQNADEAYVNRSAVFLPATGEHGLPALMVKGVLVFAYVRDGVIRVSVDLDDSELSAAALAATVAASGSPPNNASAEPSPPTAKYSRGPHTSATPETRAKVFHVPRKIRKQSRTIAASSARPAPAGLVVSASTDRIVPAFPYQGLALGGVPAHGRALHILRRLMNYLTIATEGRVSTHAAAEQGRSVAVTRAALCHFRR